MRLRRIGENFRDQNWFAVAIDFVILVVGVFVGLQVSNWNANLADAASYRDAMARLGEESSEIIQSSANTSAFIQSQLVVVQTAIAALETCQTGDEAKASIDRGLNSIRSSLGGDGQSDALDLLVTDERLLARQSTEERAYLRQYSQALASAARTSESVQSTVEIIEVDKHPLVGFSRIIDPESALNGVDVRRALTTQPPDIVCNDPTFLKLFYRWERAHVYQLSLQKALRENVAEKIEALGLIVDTPIVESLK